MLRAAAAAFPARRRLRRRLRRRARDAARAGASRAIWRARTACAWSTTGRCPRWAWTASCMEAARRAGRGRAASRELARDPRVDWASRCTSSAAAGGAARRSAVPTQPAGRAWHLRRTARAGHRARRRVAVIDSGVDAAHPDLRGQVVADAQFRRRQCLRAPRRTAPRSPGSSPRAPTTASASPASRRGARLLALRACWQLARGGAACSSFSLAKALQFAIEARGAGVQPEPDRAAGSPARRGCSTSRWRAASAWSARSIARLPTAVSRRRIPAWSRSADAAPAPCPRGARARPAATFRRRAPGGALGPGVGHVIRRRAGQRPGRAAA